MFALADLCCFYSVQATVYLFPFDLNFLRFHHAAWDKPVQLDLLRILNDDVVYIVVVDNVCHNLLPVVLYHENES